MKRLVLFSWLLATFINTDLISQSKVEIKMKFYDAESWILFEDYKEALFLYQQLHRIYPDNSNYKYRIGQCYINTPGEKEKAISYLEDAVKNINSKYKEGKFRETGAPYDAFYYLANAYRINNQLEKALETYELFRKNLNPEVYDTTVVLLQMQSCLNAMKLMSKPFYVKEKNLGSRINDGNSEFNPVVSDNEDLLIFSKSGPFYDEILYSTRTDGQWSVPQNINELLKVDKDLFPTSLSKDGNDLYLYRSADYDGIIYVTRLENGSWSPLVKLNENINTKYWESHATISHDNKKLYFTSNRKGTFGGLDIYFSKRDSTGNWGPALNLGPVINTPYNEESPSLSQDDKTLFFSSRGHFNMGGYDIFYSTIHDNGEWSVPLNAGYPLNSTDDDVFFKPLNEGYEGYYAKESPDGFGKLDIYRIEIFNGDHPRKFILRGIVKVADLISNINDSVKISTMNIKNPDQTLIVYSNPETGEYEFQLPQGNYQIIYEGYGGMKIEKKLDIPLTNPSDSFILPSTILPRTDFTADLFVESNKTISVIKGDSILFPLKVEPKSILTIERWEGDSLVSIEQCLISDSTFNYKMSPGIGDNKVVFKLTDRFNNTITTDVIITREKELTNQPLISPEYSRIISKKQISELISRLKSRADHNLLKFLEGVDIEKQQFGKADDLISFLKEEAARQSINPEELDKLSLRVAVMDNILSQAAINLLAKYTDGDLKKILADLDIYQSNLKTWSDLQEYVSEKTDGKMSPEELNKIAASILTDIDPSISIIKEKILAFSDYFEAKSIIRQSVANVDSGIIKIRNKWLQAFFYESVKQGLTYEQLSEMLAKISSFPGTQAEQFLNDLIGQSDGPLLSSLKSLVLKKEKIDTPKDLVLFLLINKDKEDYPEEAVSESFANLIIAKDIPLDIIASSHKTGNKGRLWILWIVLGAGLSALFIVFRKIKKNNKNQVNNEQLF